MTTPETTPLADLPGCWRDVTVALTGGIDRLLLYGVPGTGKTFGGLHIGVSDDAPRSHRLVCTEDMTSADVTGAWMPDAAGTFRWLDGAATLAWIGDGTTGSRLVADECDKASGDVLGLLLAMFDSDGSATFDHPGTGETIAPNPGFSVVMTSNVEDPDNLPDALRDRFPVAVCINAPHPDALALLPADLRDAAARIVACEDPGRRASLRAFFAFDRMRTNGVSVEDAGRLAFGDGLWREMGDALRIASVER